MVVNNDLKGAGRRMMCKELQLKGSLGEDREDEQRSRRRRSQMSQLQSGVSSFKM